MKVGGGTGCTCVIDGGVVVVYVVACVCVCRGYMCDGGDGGDGGDGDSGVVVVCVVCMCACGGGIHQPVLVGEWCGRLRAVRCCGAWGEGRGGERSQTA